MRLRKPSSNLPSAAEGAWGKTRFTVPLGGPGVWRTTSFW